VKVNESNVIATDVDASNGVIHVIDAVLVPPTVDVAALTS
jgi:transforming growth factor-beta-induced protein